MFQDIGPHKLDNEFKKERPAKGDYIVVYRNDSNILFRKTHDGLSLPHYGMI